MVPAEPSLRAAFAKLGLPYSYSRRALATASPGKRVRPLCPEEKPVRLKGRAENRKPAFGPRVDLSSTLKNL